MKKKPKPRQDQGQLSQSTLRFFDAHFRSVYGPRWSSLLSALQKPVCNIMRLSGFVPNDEMAALLAPYNCRPVVALAVHPVLDNCLAPENSIPGNPLRVGGLCTYYQMDFASVVAACCLGVVEGDRVLDLCAAPGGKSLVLAELAGPSGFVVCNEASAARRGRLARVIRDYVPEDRMECIKITGHDATQWKRTARGPQLRGFDAVLLDAPCSSERHLLHDPKELAMWTPKRTRQNAKRQFDILLQAIQLVKPAGRLLYSTCSISPLENDELIEKLLKKRSALIQVAPSDIWPLSPVALGAEVTTYGFMFYPDTSDWGPMYICLLTSCATAEPASDEDDSSGSDGGDRGEGPGDAPESRWDAADDGEEEAEEEDAED